MAIPEVALVHLSRFHPQRLDATINCIVSSAEDIAESLLVLNARLEIGYISATAYRTVAVHR